MTSNSSSDGDRDDLSEHTISMRKALDYCQQLGLLAQKKKRKWVNCTCLETARDAYIASRLVFEQKHHHDTIEVVDASDMTVLEFRKRFLHRNVPCLVRGLDVHFQHVTSEWGCEETRLKWFERVVGSDTLVPVVVTDSEQEELDKLDQDGRATECTMIHCTLKKWMHDLRLCSQSCYYLKDWHLKGVQYEVPPQFQGDLLNGFLTKFTTGDYKFVYWGPAGSGTALHSDVLNSFSWSYNVAGTKEWTFLPGSTIQQNAGETMFVPSGWKHKVRNLCETLSINRNWVTSANVHCVAECIQQEVAAIELEMEAWELPIRDFEARESMLRGCIGLDVTAYFFLVLTEQLRRLKDEKLLEWEDYYDAFRLHAVLKSLVDAVEQGSAPNNEAPLFVKDCVAAVLHSEELANLALDIASVAIETVNDLEAILTDG